jgi:broad specificity phosphatase PhoE
MDVYFVRHGQAEGNETAVFKRPDAPLTVQGVAESKVLAAKVKTLQPALIVTGPLLRTRQTAEIIEAETGITTMVHDGFAGVRHASSMAGMPKEGEEAKVYLRTIKEMYSNDPDAHFEDAENYTEFHARLCGALQFLEQRDEESIVVITHESILKSLLILILHNKVYNPAFNLDLKTHMGAMSNTGVTKFTYTDTWKLISWNEN